MEKLDVVYGHSTTGEMKRFAYSHDTQGRRKEASFATIPKLAESGQLVDSLHKSNRQALSELGYSSEQIDTTIFSLVRS